MFKSQEMKLNEKHKIAFDILTFLIKLNYVSNADAIHLERHEVNEI